MAASYEETMSIPFAADAVWQLAIRVPNTQPRISQVQTCPGMLTGIVGVNWRSWGEKLTVRVDPGPDCTHVSIRSECVLPTQIIDWGKNKANVQLIRVGLEPLGQTDVGWS